MKKERSSLTAWGIAFARALESSKPENERICYDPFARKFISPIFYGFVKLFVGHAERRSPGVIGYIVARCRYFDDYLETCLREGVEQVVILGAGLDSRAYRFEALKKPTRVFEVDRPVTQRNKIELVKSVLGYIPSHVSFIPVDFSFETLQKLYHYGYNRDPRTLFIWEGVTPYLQESAVDQTLEFVVNNSPSGSTIIFDYVHKSALNSPHKRGEIVRMERVKRFTGEGLVFGIEENQIYEFMKQHGFSNITNVNHDDLKKLYFTGLKEERCIAPIYSIVHASV